MKVLHITSPKSWRGGEQQLMYLVEELNGVEIKQKVMCPVGSVVHRYCEEKGIPFVTYRKRFSMNPMVGFLVKKWCTKEGIDIVHAHDSHAHTFAVMAATLAGNRVPVVVSRRVDFAPSKSLLSRYKYNHSQVKAILCVSKAIREIMTAFIRDTKKLEVVYSGIDLSKFHTERGGILRELYGIPEDELLIGNVAALAPHKDYLTFLKTARLLLDRGVQARFIAIGDGPEKSMIEEAIQEMGLKDQVILAGFRKDVPVVLPELDVFLITSKTEGLGTSVLDAMASGVPVVACAAGGIVELVSHGENGLLCPVGDAAALADAVVNMLADKVLREKCILGGWEKVAQFTKERMAAETLKIYRRVTEDGECLNYDFFD